MLLTRQQLDKLHLNVMYIMYLQLFSVIYNHPVTLSLTTNQPAASICHQIMQLFMDFINALRIPFARQNIIYKPRPPFSVG